MASGSGLDVEEAWDEEWDLTRRQLTCEMLAMEMARLTKEPMQRDGEDPGGAVQTRLRELLSDR